VPFLPIAALYGVALILPMAAIVTNAASLSPGDWGDLLRSAIVVHAVRNTVMDSLIIAVTGTVLAYLLAAAIWRAGPSGRVVLIALVIIPFWTSVLVRSYAWMVLLGRHGVINEALGALGLIDAPLRLLNTPLAVQIAMVHILLPYMILPIANALRQIDPSLARAASGLGATPWRTFRQVVFPLSMPGVAAGTLLVFVLSLGFYITPAMLGGPRDITLSMLIAMQVDNLNWAYAAALSTVLLATALVIIALFQRLPGIGNAFTMSAR